ncbi:ankyrin repeat-containing protein At5g02620 [Malania oleifera]|uniref:ankyrin repeat-containing protein At5g02620 n=1 Tax=Malania oleifera TaxID=397392 RepID=UPI0025ADF4C0|nr:ankyrin repeat-containing protein At5g02620 [Malania oleifera]
MEGRLYEAALTGNASTLNALIQADPLLLDRSSVAATFDQSPLHIAAMRGHLEFAILLLSKNPELANEVDWLGRSPLHLAAAKGHSDVVRALLSARPKACLVRDQDGRLPLHLAAMKGRVEVIRELICALPESTHATVGRGETVLHLCVKYGRLEALKVLMEFCRRKEFVTLINAKDGDGNTILHLAAALKQEEAIKYLLSITELKKLANALNGNGFTALDVAENSPVRDIKSLEICNFLLGVGVRRNRDFLEINSTTDEHIAKVPPEKSTLQQRISGMIRKQWRVLFPDDPAWIKETRGSLMTSATVIASMAFQVALNPPGGAWDEPNPTDAKTNTSFEAGTAIGAAKDRSAFDKFILFDELAFFTSLGMTMLLASGFPTNNRVCTCILAIAMCLTLAFSGLTYYYAINLILPYNLWFPSILVMVAVLGVLFVEFCIITLYLVIHLVEWLWNKCPKAIKFCCPEANR